MQDNWFVADNAHLVAGKGGGGERYRDEWKGGGGVGVSNCTFTFCTIQILLFGVFVWNPRVGKKIIVVQAAQLSCCFVTTQEGLCD